MSEFVQYLFWVFVSRIACETKSRKLLVTASIGLVNSVNILAAKYPGYDLSELKALSAELKQISDELIREAAHE